MEDDEHMMAGCSATGTHDWPSLLAEAWGVAARAVGTAVTMPPAATLVQDPLMLLADILPLQAASDWGLPAPKAPNSWRLSTARWQPQ